MMPINRGDRFILPSGRAVQVITTFDWSDRVSCRYMRLGALVLTPDAVVDLTEDFLGLYGKRIKPISHA